MCHWIFGMSNVSFQTLEKLRKTLVSIWNFVLKTHSPYMSVFRQNFTTECIYDYHAYILLPTHPARTSVISVKNEHITNICLNFSMGVYENFFYIYFKWCRKICDIGIKSIGMKWYVLVRRSELCWDILKFLFLYACYGIFCLSKFFYCYLYIF